MLLVAFILLAIKLSIDIAGNNKRRNEEVRELELSRIEKIKNDHQVSLERLRVAKKIKDDIDRVDEEKAAAFKALENIEKEKTRKIEQQKFNAHMVTLKAELDEMLYKVNKESIDRKNKRMEKLYYSAEYGEYAKYQHDGSRYIVFDLETTGLEAGRHRIIEIAAIRCINDLPVEKFQVLLRLEQGKKVPKRIVELTGITDQLLLEEGRDFGEAIAEFSRFIGDDKLISYNIDFDFPFLEYALHPSPLKNKKSCILKMARRKWRTRDSFKLIHVAEEECDCKIGGAHRAMKDVELAHEVLLSIAYF